MKILSLLPFVLGLSSPAFAAATAWQDFGLDDSVRLTQNLKLEGKNGGAISVRMPGQYTLESITPLEGLSVVDYVFAPTACRIPEIEGTLTMVLPSENAPNSKAEVGVYFLKGCQLEVLVETKDLAKPSLFRK
jgi:hypothetical protein